MNYVEKHGAEKIQEAEKNQEAEGCSKNSLELSFEDVDANNPYYCYALCQMFSNFEDSGSLSQNFKYFRLEASLDCIAYYHLIHINDFYILCNTYLRAMHPTTGNKTYPSHYQTVTISPTTQQGIILTYYNWFFRGG